MKPFLLAALIATAAAAIAAVLARRSDFTNDIALPREASRYATRSGRGCFVCCYHCAYGSDVGI
jgi:hypothetical protein